MSYFPCDIPFMSEDEKKKNGIKCNSDVDKDINVPSNDTISRQAAIDALLEEVRLIDGYYVENDEVIDKDDAIEAIRLLPSAQPERVWTPCDIPPEHHKDVIVRGIEPLGNVTVHKIMQWDVDRWRPEDYAPSVIWLDWSEI